MYKDKLNLDQLPKHIAIIMDGNGRWAKSKGEARTFGHRKGISAVRDVINGANEIGVEYLTLYTFSSENWNRPKGEVDSLMGLLSETLLEEAENIFSKGLKLHVIGDMSQLPQITKEHLQHVIDLTKDNTNGNLVLALNYGAHQEIVKAVQEIGKELKNNDLSVEEINEEMIEKHLYTKDIPPVDLLIRTSGEVRVSNFLLWQIAYAEMQFLEVLWPDFTKEMLFECIYNFQHKERRYGKISEQLK